MSARRVCPTESLYSRDRRNRRPSQPHTETFDGPHAISREIRQSAGLVGGPTEPTERAARSYLSLVCLRDRLASLRITGQLPLMPRMRKSAPDAPWPRGAGVA